MVPFHVSRFTIKNEFKNLKLVVASHDGDTKKVYIFYILGGPEGPEPALGRLENEYARSDATSKWKHTDVPGT